MLEVKSILISQPDPGDRLTPYHDLAKRYGLKIDFRPFIEVNTVPGKLLRRKRLNILDFTAVIFTSRNAVDNYFRVVEEIGVDLPPTMKYFCINEGLSLYIQKYTVLRKRKVFIGQKKEEDLFPLFKKHSKEKFLLPCSNISKEIIPSYLDEIGADYRSTVMYTTDPADLSDLADVSYDIVVFFSPADISSLFINFPDFKQKNTRIAGWGESTSKAMEENGLINNIYAPTPETPSMVAALENYLKEL